MTCNKCGECCDYGYYWTSEVIDGLYDNLSKVMDHLLSRGYEPGTNLLDFINHHQMTNINSPSPCLFKADDNHCIIHPTIIGANIRGPKCEQYECK